VRIPEVTYFFECLCFRDAGEVLVPTFAHVVYVPFRPYLVHSRSRRCCLSCGQRTQSGIDLRPFIPQQSIRLHQLCVPIRQIGILDD
jgi:hypothetical protein